MLNIFKYLFVIFSIFIHYNLNIKKKSKNLKILL